MFHHAFDLGHEPSARDYLYTAFAAIDANPSKPAGGFGVNDPIWKIITHTTFFIGHMFENDIRKLRNALPDSKIFQSSEVMAYAHIQYVLDAFRDAHRKPLLAKQYGYLLHSFQHENTTDLLRKKARDTEIAMNMAAVESDADRTDASICFDTPHKSAVSSLIYMAFSASPNPPNSEMKYRNWEIDRSIDEKFTEWLLDGRFEEKDLQKMQKWVTLAIQTHTPRRRRRRR